MVEVNCCFWQQYNFPWGPAVVEMIANGGNEELRSVDGEGRTHFKVGCIFETSVNCFAVLRSCSPRGGSSLLRGQVAKPIPMSSHCLRMWIVVRTHDTESVCVHVCVHTDMYAHKHYSSQNYWIIMWPLQLVHVCCSRLFGVHVWCL